MSKKIIRLTESELKNLINHSVKKVLAEAHGYVPNQGNHMVGGKWGRYNNVTSTTNILDKFIDALYEIEDDNPEWEKFEQYCTDNEDSFDVQGTLSASYDESTGWGSADNPIYELEEVDADYAFEVVKQYPNEMVVGQAMPVLQEVVDGLSSYDFENLDGYDY